MEPLAGISMFIEGRAVETRQRVTIDREMRRDPIDQHTDVGLVAIVHEISEVVRRAETAGRRKITSRLIPPRAVERVFADR